MARSSSGFVAGLTAAALAGVCFLAYQAQAHAPDSLAKPSKDATSTTPRSPKDKADPTALPEASGRGERVVYALGADRVWLVGEDGKAQRTYKVTPSTVDPLPGTYKVGSRSGPAIVGSDGVRIEHVVRFTSVENVAIGFSAAVDGSTPKPDPDRKTGGIRQSRADGDAMWDFATVGRKIVVVP
ncbi:hypothetical protein P8605_42530 [Streptomyces sp. T-3]|nr:hypothetical protein [Streptomyces sp. T-3]